MDIEKDTKSLDPAGNCLTQAILLSYQFTNPKTEVNLVNRLFKYLIRNLHKSRFLSIIY